MYSVTLTNKPTSGLTRLCYGTAFSFVGVAVEFTVQRSGGATAPCSFKVERDPKELPMQIRFGDLFVTFFNPPSGGTSGSPSPVIIAQAEGIALIFSFQVTFLNTDYYSLAYEFIEIPMGAG